MSADEDKFSILLSPTRKRIFEYICDNPGSHLNDIVRNVESSQGNVHHHLSELHGSGLVKKMESDGKTIYYPSGLRDADIETAFSQLKNVARRLMFLHVLNNPGSNQNDVIKSVNGSRSHRHLLHLRSLVASGLVSANKIGRNIIYTVGDVGRKIVLGSFEKVDPFITTIKEKLGHDVAVTFESRGNGDFIVVDLMNGERITIQLGKWAIMDIDEEILLENKYVLLGDGGEKVLVSLYNGCSSVSEISSVTAIPESVVRAKINTLRVMKLIVDRPGETGIGHFDIADAGKKMTMKTFGIKKGS